METSGLKAPVSNIIASISELFPTPHRQYQIESSILRTFTQDFLPVNATAQGEIQEMFAEFVIPPTEGEFIDTRQILLELKLHITKGANAALDQTDFICLINGALHQFIAQQEVSFNGIQVERNNLFGLWNYLRLLTSLDKDQIENIGRMGFFFNNVSALEINPTSGQLALATAADDLKPMLTASKRSIHLLAPLLLDIGNFDRYLLDKVQLRIKLNFQKPQYMILSNVNNINYNISLKKCKLHLTKVIPQPSALLALQNNLLKDNTSIQYDFIRPLTKQIILQQNDTNYTVDNPFGEIIPQKIYMVIVDQNALNGDFLASPTYFHHSRLENITISINGVNHTNINANFQTEPFQYQELLYHTLKSIGLHKRLYCLDYSSYPQGRTIIALDLSNSETDDMKLERSGHLRITLKFGVGGRARNQVLLMFAETQGIIEINADRRVFCHYLQ